MRNPANNPIERLERLLAEVQDLLAAFDQNAKLLETLIPSRDWPNTILPRPPMVEYEKECVRRDLDYKRARRVRQSVATLRARGGSHKALIEQAEASREAGLKEYFGFHFEKDAPDV